MVASSVGSTGPVGPVSPNVNANRKYTSFITRGKKLINDGERYRNQNVNTEGKNKFNKIVKDLKNLVQEARTEFKKDGGTNNGSIKVKEMAVILKRPSFNINKSSQEELIGYIKYFLGITRMGANKKAIIEKIPIEKLRDAIRFMVSREGEIIGLGLDKKTKQKLVYNILNETLTAENINGYVTRGRLQALLNAIKRGKGLTPNARNAELAEFIKNMNNGASSSGSSP